mgnify:CR=1 FL=1
MPLSIMLPLIRKGALCALALFLAPVLALAQNTTVFAAASLKNALDDVVKAYGESSGQKVVVSYAASPALARQIESGAPADIFISADLDWMNYLEKKSLINVKSRQNLLKNRLVLIAPGSSKAAVIIAPKFPLASALGNGRLAMADPESVPAGKYGKAALEKLGVWGEVSAKVAPAADVRAAMLLVSRGEAPFGIVYSTDAFVDKAVRIVDDFPENSHPPIIYPVALTSTSKAAAAGEFLKFLMQAQVRAIFEKYGFK